MKSLKKPVPAPRSLSKESKPPATHVTEHHGYPDSSGGPRNDCISSTDLLHQFAMRKEFTEQEFNQALQRTILPVDINNFLLQLIAVRTEGSLDTNALHNKLVLLPKPREIHLNLRNIVIDGSNVAMTHGNKNQCFSNRGIKIAVDWFLQRGHPSVKVFVPEHRKEAKGRNRDVDILHELSDQGIAFFTPSTENCRGSRVTCYDDRFILKCASEDKAVVLSNDKYKDLINEDAGFRETIRHRLLTYMFAGDKFIPADDPMGRKGPTLEQFLRNDALDTKTGSCPYGRKCTYGSKCRYSHPEREESAILDEVSIVTRQREISASTVTENNNIQFSSQAQPLFNKMATGYPTSEPWLAGFSNHSSVTQNHLPLLSRSAGDSLSEQIPRVQKQVGPQRVPLKRESSCTYPSTTHMVIHNRPHSLPPTTLPRDSLPYFQESSRNIGINPMPPNQHSMNIQMASLRIPGDTLIRHASPGAPMLHTDDQATRENSAVRNKLYYHLRGLFEENKVREAMRRLPHETDVILIIEEVKKMK